MDDDDQTTTFPSLGNLSLTGDNLADEDFADQSNLVDASFEYDSQPQRDEEDDTDLLPPPVAGLPLDDEYAYQGSMGAPLPASTSHTDASVLPARATTPSRPVGQARVVVEEDDELGEDGSEEDKARWEELRNERDRLRALNKMLLQVSAGFDQVEGKMEVRTLHRFGIDQSFARQSS